MNKPEANKIVQVEWLDSKGVTSDWEFWDDVDPLIPAVCVSVGFLLEETNSHKTIAMTVSDEQTLGRMSIPTGRYA